MDDSYMRPDVIMEQQQGEEIDYFDHLPDPIVVVILNKIYDARSLCRCLAVSKRFASLIPEVGSVCITMKSPKMKKPIEDGPKSRNGPKSSFKNFVSRMLTKPFSFLLNNKKLLNSSSSSSGVGFGGGGGVDVFNWVGDVLKNFHHVEMISLELPCHGGEMGMTTKSMPLLKWEAGFGKGMEGCVILGATSVVPGSGSGCSCSCSCRRSCTGLGICNEPNGENDVDVDEEEPLFSDEELRLRIIWIISCLIASSGRHNLMKKVLAQCPKLSNAVISDAGNQGKLHMNKAQIQELRASIGIDDTTHINVNNNNNSRPPPEAGGRGVGATPSSSSQMGYVGNLVMKLWYVKELELPGSGKVMKGATLVVIKPESKVNAGIDRVEEGDGVSLCGGFEGDKVFEEAAKELLKRKWKREYRLEVNSF